MRGRAVLAVTALALFQRLADCRSNLGADRLFHQHVLCGGVCPGTRPCGVVCGGCCGQCGISGLCVLLGKFFVEGAETQLAEVVEVGLVGIEK